MTVRDSPLNLTEAGHEMLVLEGHTAAVYALAFSPDGQFLASGAKDLTVNLWDESLASTEIVTPGRDIPAPVNSLSWNSTGTRLAIATGKGPCFVRYESGVSSFLWALNMPATSVRFLTDTLVAIGVGERGKPNAGSLELWDVAQQKRREPRFNAQNGVRAVAVHPATRRVAWTEWGGVRQPGPRMFIWDITRPDPTRFPLPNKATDVVFHPDGTQLAIAIEWEVRTYDLGRKQERFRLKGHKGMVTCVAASPDGRVVASGSWDGSVRLWDWATGAETAGYNWPIGKITALAYSPDGLRLAAGGDEGRIMLWDTA